MKDFLRNTWKHRAHVIMALPVFLVLLFIMYVPMAGLSLAFKSYDVQKGLFGSPWCGLDNFKFLVASKTMFKTITLNTVKYYFIFTAIGTVLNVALAIAIDQFIVKKMSRVMQTIMIIPVFISYAAVTFIVDAFLDTSTGFLAKSLGSTTNFYNAASAHWWVLILIIVKIWKDTGYGSVLYMSVLAGIDAELYEAADIDGAGKWRKIWHITIPSLIPMITVMLLLSVGNIMRGDTGLFYQVTRHVGTLFNYTEVIDSYVLYSIRTAGISSYGFTAATSLFQSCVGLLMMLLANWTVRKIQPENALF